MTDQPQATCTPTVPDPLAAVQFRLDSLDESLNTLSNIIRGNVLKANYLTFAEVRQHFINGLHVDGVTEGGFHYAYQANVAMHLVDRYNIEHSLANTMALSILDLLFPAADAKPAEFQPRVPPARKIVHLSIGSPDWEPTQEEIQQVVDQFTLANLDPYGSIVGTPAHVTSVLCDELQVTQVPVPTTLPVAAPATVKLALCMHTIDAPAYYLNEVYDIVPLSNDAPFFNTPTFLVDRALCETDESLLQLLPYATLIDEEDGRILGYYRGANGGEARLHGNLSLGGGGHVDEDTSNYLDATDEPPLLRLLQIEMARELNEEFGINIEPGTIQFSGLIRDTTNPVGRVHIGVHAVIKVNKNDIRDMEPGIIERSDWFTLNQLQSDVTYARLENWSKLVIDKLVAA